MISAEPKSFYSWNFQVFSGQNIIALLDISWLREKGEFTLEDNHYQLVKEAIFSGNFSLEQNGSTIAAARKTAMIRSFEVRFAGRSYTLRAMHALTRKFVIEDSNGQIGTIIPDHIFTRRCTVDLPGSIPLEIQLFMLWLTLLMWRRAAQAAAAGQ